MRLKVMEMDGNWMPLNGGSTASGEKEAAQYDTSCVQDESGVNMKESKKRCNGVLDMNKKKRPRTIKHRPKIYDDSKPNKVLNSQSPNSANPTPKKPETPKTPKTVAPNRVQKKSKNSKRGFQLCKHSLDFDVGKADNSGEIATFKRNLPRSCRFRKKSLEASQNLLGDISETSNEEQAEETGRQDIHVYQRRSNISSKAIFLFTPAFHVYQRANKENGKATALGEQEAAQYDTSSAQDEECEGEKSHCGHESGVDIKASRKRRNEGLDMNKKKRHRIKRHKPKIYDDSKPNKVSKFQTSNSSTRTPKTSETPTTLKTTATPKTPQPVTPNRVQKKCQKSKHNNSTCYGFESCKRSLDFDAGKFDNSGMIATLKRNLPRKNCRYPKKSLEASQNLLGDISKTSNEENGQKHFYVYQRRSNISSNAICLFMSAFESYQRRIKVNGRKDIHVYRRRSKKNNCLQHDKRCGPNFPKMNKKQRALRKKSNTNRWYVKEDEENKSLVTRSSKKSTQISKKMVDNAITVAKKAVVDKKLKVTANVDLDHKSLSVWKMLMENDGSEPVDIDKDEWWQKQGKIFGRRVDSFLEKMRLVQGNMQFSPWKGSVTDSVVGAYLTQNVTDHFSSSAFMSVAARFPPKIRNKKLSFDDEFASSQESVASTSFPDASRTTEPVQDKFCGLSLNKRKGEKRKKIKKKQETEIDWEELRKSYCGIGEKEVNENYMDAVDWDAVRRGTVEELSQIIEDRGMQNKLAKRIKVDFLDRIYKEHGSLDLEWLRNVPPNKAKKFLLSFFGIGLKSVECVRLLTLHHLAFPVDTNVARVATRLGWVPLQSLPDHVPIHLLNAYPPFNNIQKYLFPRLCTLDKEKLYELHCHLITFGKVFCSKKKPNCVACPMKAECLHYASAFPSRRLAISGSEESSCVTSIIPVTDELRHSVYVTLPRSSFEKEGNNSVSTYCEPIIEAPPSPKPLAEETYPVINDIEDLCNPQSRSMYVTPPSSSFEKEVNNPGSSSFSQTCEPIIETPPSPEPEAKKTLPFIADIEDLVYDDDDDDDDGDGDDDEDNGGDHNDDMSQALVLTSVEEALDIRAPKKFAAKWRTMHLVYELPDDHPCLAGFEAREHEDPTPYLLALWFPGENRNSPEYVYNRKYILNKDNREETIKATILIPCRTATRGSFPLNGTYFQVNEVFADHETSHVPLEVPRSELMNLQIRILGCGTSTSSIHKELSTSAIQRLFCTGSICVRGFDRKTREPKQLHKSFHTTRKAVAAENSN